MQFKIFTFIIFLTCCSCSNTAQFRSKQSPELANQKATSFSILKSGQIAEAARKESRIIKRNPYFVESIQAAITRELIQKGYRQTNTSQADIVFGFRTGVRDQRALSTEQQRYKTGTSRSLFPEAGPRTRPHLERILVIQCFDGRSGRILWQGIAENLLPEFYESEKGLVSVIRNTLDTFPARDK